LNPAPTFRVKGPEALKFFADHCVNSFENFAVGTLKHAVMCNDRGLVVAHGVLLRLAEDDFISYFLAPYAAHMFYSGGYDAQGEWVQDMFMLQVAGPRSLEVLEAATGQCLHDIRFGHHRPSAIKGTEVRVARMGMAGTLGYEVHGPVEEAVDLYQAILEAGESFGIVKIGWRAWQMHHTANGFPRSFVHFPLPWGEDKGFMAFMKFPPEDVVDVYASQFQRGEPCAWMETLHMGQHQGQNILHADQVLKDGKVIGVSSGRTYSHYSRQMLSLCSIDVEYAEIGEEVAVIWGEPGSRQKEIRAAVARFPYLSEGRNENVDVNTIPCLVAESNKG